MRSTSRLAVRQIHPGPQSFPFRDIQERLLHRYYDSLGRALSLGLVTPAGTSQYRVGYGYDAAARLDRVWHHPALDAVTKAPTGNPTFTYGHFHKLPFHGLKA